MPERRHFHGSDPLQRRADAIAAADALADQLAAVWPDDCDLDERDVEAIQDLSRAVARLADSLGDVRVGYLLYSLGRKIGLS